MRLPIQIQGIVFRKNKGKTEFLLLKRIPEKGNFWQPPCGGLESTDKSNIEAVYRELKEEAGIERKEILKEYENVHYFEFSANYLTGKKEHVTKEYVFAFEVKPETKVCIDCNPVHEHSEFKWVPFEEAIKMLKWKNNEDGFRKLMDLISR